ncbi:MAG: Tat proofreading chaperone DmsD [Deferribacteraceae bacterium]|jgi:TorA maturation chaperone TorD|nr:Tat proofreading chaperone DmsD [Deferribacteraceae bacterium]
MIAFSEIEATAKILGVVFYHSPASSNSLPVHELLASDIQWPISANDALTLIQKGLQARDSMNAAYEELFIGTGSLMAPPWGSVYLDKENLMSGDSLMELKAFLRKTAIQLDTGMNEPEDHIGLLFFMVAVLANAKDKAHLEELLREHVLTWAYRYFELLQQHATHPFYEGAAKLGAITIKNWQDALDIKCAEKKLYK